MNEELKAPLELIYNQHLDKTKKDNNHQYQFSFFPFLAIGKFHISFLCFNQEHMYAFFHYGSSESALPTFIFLNDIEDSLFRKDYIFDYFKMSKTEPYLLNSLNGLDNVIATNLMYSTKIHDSSLFIHERMEKFIHDDLGAKEINNVFSNAVISFEKNKLEQELTLPLTCNKINKI